MFLIIFERPCQSEEVFEDWKKVNLTLQSSSSHFNHIINFREQEVGSEKTQAC